MMRRAHGMTCAVLAGLLVPMSARAQETAPETVPETATPADLDEVVPLEDAEQLPPPEETEPPPDPTARELHAEGCAALNEQDRDRARTLLRKMRRRYPDAWETAALAQLLGQATPAETDRLHSQEPPAPWAHQRPRHADDGFVRYSRATGERKTSRGWEQADFVVTGLAYGTGVGAAYSIGFDLDDGALAPVVLGAAIYGILAGTYLGAGKPDRGDLPVALSIAAYIPVTALFGSLAAEAGDQEIALAVALSGTAALPAAALAVAYTDLDPGDVQLTRDAGFWGMVLTLAGTGGFACESYGCDESTLGIAGLVGLYAGLGAGVVLASHTEVSLERVRLTTLVGYGGGLIGGITGAFSDADEVGAARGVMLGGAIGLLMGALATMSVDRSPHSARAATELSPTLVLMPLVDRSGEILPALGVELFTP